MNKTFKKLILILVSLFFLVLIVFYFIGTALISPARQKILIPDSLQAKAITFQSESGETISGSFILRNINDPILIIMHGLRSNRNSMISRAEKFSKLGFGVLIFDFQSHGESTGDHITFGFKESLDAKAAVKYIRSNYPNNKIGVIGQSLGGASALVGLEPIKADAYLLESVYTTFDKALGNRVKMRLGNLIGQFTWPLTIQMKYRLGISPDDLRPIDSIKKLTSPVLIIGGTHDVHTTKEETLQLYQTANEPKEIEFFEGAIHEDYEKYDSKKYYKIVVSFFNKYLKN